MKIEKTRKLESPATIELLGLPNEVTAEQRQIDDAASEVVFPITTTSKSPRACTRRSSAGGREIARRADHACRGRRELGYSPVAAQDRGRRQACPQSRTVNPIATKPPITKPLGRLERLRLEKKGEEVMTEKKMRKSEIRNTKQIEKQSKKYNNMPS